MRTASDNLTGKELEIFQQRGSVYGDANINLEAFSKFITAVIETHYQMRLPHVLPGHISGLIMVGSKVLRATNPFEFQHDNYDDLHVYAEMSRANDSRNPGTDTPSQDDRDRLLREHGITPSTEEAS